MSYGGDNTVDPWTTQELVALTPHSQKYAYNFWLLNNYWRVSSWPEALPTANIIDMFCILHVSFTVFYNEVKQIALVRTYKIVLGITAENGHPCLVQLSKE